MKIKLHKGDLPASVNLGPLITIDSETWGSIPMRDRLCLVQLSSGDGVCHAVQIHFRMGLSRQISNGIC